MSLGALAALALGTGRSAVAQWADVESEAHTAPVGGVEIGPVAGYRAREPFATPRAKPERNVGVTPSSDAVWIRGFWDLQGNPKLGPRAGWRWVPGHWAVPPRPGMHWQPGYWEWRDEWWNWTPAHWVLWPAGGLDSLN